MAAIDDKVRALNFTVTTFLTTDQIHTLIDDAATVSRGDTIILTKDDPHRVKGKARNFLRVTHAAFTVALTPSSDGSTTVVFRIGDYLRTRDTLLYFIPVSPWSAPAYKTLKDFSEHLRSKL